MHKSLRVLMLGEWVTLDGPPCHKAFRNLRYLRVGDITAFPFNDPSKLDKLRVFLNRSKPGMNLSHLPSSVQRIYHEVPYVECNEFKKLPFQNLSCLKSFIVKTQKSVELPEEVHLPASLVDLHLSRCKNLPKDIGHLTALQSLILDRSDLERLPQGFGKLQKLKHLSMDYCSKLAFLSKELGNISSLESLSMEGCGNLRALPESFGKLRIDKLNFRSLVDLQKLPNGFGNMPLLKYLRLESCHSLMSLPHSFVQLKMLETLEIIGCTKLSVLPNDFGQLIYLKYVTMEYCPLLKELPHGFGALPVLKTFKMKCCKGFVNLPRDFSGLASLEELRLESLHLISWIPDGFGKLSRLRFLDLYRCLELKTLSDDFENMASLELLAIRHCPEIDGAIMEKILKLQSCFMADVYGSDKLLEKWEEMKDEQEHPIAVLCLDYGEDRDRENRAIWVALLNGKCLELNNTTGRLIERSSLLGELKEGTNATVALIIVPIQVQSHQHQMLQRFVEMAMETAKTNGSGMLQIVCARKFVWSRERRTQTEEEERAEEEGIRQILLLLPEGSCVIPSTESKRAKIITWCCIRYDSFDEFHFFIGHVVVDMEGRKTFENFEFVDAHALEGRKSFENFEVVEEGETSEIVRLETVITNKHHNSIQNFIESICFRDADVAGENKTRKFIETLKGNGIDYLLIEGQQLMVDDLLGKTIGFILCTFKHFEFIKLQQMFKDLQQKDSNFIAIWIPTVRPEDFGHGTYTRPTQCRPWATFPFQLVKVLNDRPRFVVLDQGGQIANKDALKLLLAWGVKSYPFTQHTISESFFSMEADSCLEFLLQGMDIAERKPMKSKMTFLYVRPPGGLERKWEFEMKCKFEELTKINGNFEVLFVGISHELDLAYHSMETRKQDYDFATQNMPWLSLSFSDMIMFWYRCKQTPHELAKMLLGLGYRRSLLLLDNNGAVTRRGYDVVQMICESSDEIWDGEGMAMVKDELMKSLSRGECSPLVRIFFRDEIRNLPQHPHHRVLYFVFDVHYFSHARNIRDFTCGVCNVHYYRDGDDWNPEMSYRCDECEWEMCGNCWIGYAKQQVEQLLSAKDN